MRDVTERAWARLTPADVARLLEPLTIRWWIAGGWALDRDGRRPHGDVDVAVLRSEHELLRRELPTWDLRIAHRGVLTPWRHGPVGPPERGVWGRPPAAAAWHVDFKIELVEAGMWVYRRDPSIRVPLDRLGVVVDGIPFLAPEIAALYRAGRWGGDLGGAP